MKEDIKELLEIAVKRYIEEYIINLDLSDGTKNMLKRQLRKTFLDEDLIGDLKTIAYKDSIPKSLVKEKIEELEKQRIKMEKDDVGVGFTLGKEWSDLKAKIEVLQELLERSREDDNNKNVK